MTRLSLGFAQHGGAAAQQTAALKTPVRVLFRGQAEEEYEEDMRHPADGGSSDGARCCRCAVPGASFFVCDPRGGGGLGKNGGDTPPVAPAVPVVERDAEGGGGGGLTDGPLDGRTNRGSNPRPRRAPAMAHTTRPSMPLTRMGAKIVFRKIRTALLCSPNPLRVVGDMCECTLMCTRQT